MKKFLLTNLLGFLIKLSVTAAVMPVAGSTLTSPATGTVTVSNASQWTNGTCPGGSWTGTDNGAPYTYVIQSGFTVIIGQTGNVTVTLGNDVIIIYGQLGFKSGNNNLTLGSSGVIDIKTGGKLGFGTGPNYRGNAAANITIGTNDQVGPFLTAGPFVATESTKFATTWTGASSTDWSTLANWDSFVPDATRNVVIPSGAPRYPVITGNNSILKMQVKAGATLTISASSNLSLDDSLVNDGTITILSTGNLYQSDNSPIGGAGTYNVEIETWGDITFITSPISNVSANGFGITPTGTNGGQLIPKSDCDPTGIDASSPYGNLLELHEDASILSDCSQSMWYVKSSGNLTNGRGYSLTTSSFPTLTFTGTINNGAVSYSGLTRQAAGSTIYNQDGSTTTTGWHLVGNPYPSGISLTAAQLNTMGFDGQIQIYDNGSWVTPNPVSPYVIPSGQGFQIRKTNVGGTSDFSLDNSFRQTSNDYLRENSLQQNFMNIAINNGTHTDTTMVYFYDGATDGFDALYDANRLPDKAELPMVYSVSDNENLKYNALPFMIPGEVKTTLLGIRTKMYGSHTLTFTNTSSLGASIWLKDIKLDSLLEVTDTSVYSFETVSGEDKNRFELRFSKEEVATSPSTAMTPVQSAEYVTLSPNPTSGETLLTLPANHGFINVAIIDMLGRVIQIYSLSDGTNSQKLRTNELNQGAYIVKLNGTYNQSFKLIKQ